MAKSGISFRVGERSANKKYRLLSKSGLRGSEAALGTITFGDERGWGSPKAEAQKIYEAYREAGGNFIDTVNVYTGGTSETFVVSSSRAIATVLFWRQNTPTPRPATIPMRRAITARA
jgi:predicted aldo/keto reductase-like oxidoreductase